MTFDELTKKKIFSLAEIPLCGTGWDRSEKLTILVLKLDSGQ